MDNNGEKIENSLKYDSESNKATISTNKTLYCYLYFDKPLSVNDLRAKSGAGLSTEPVGGMYRYQGTTADNYICLKQLGSAGCSNQSDEMYRIIGITEEGNIKVIKQIKYNDEGTSEFAWNTKYNETSTTEKYKCDVSGCPEWPSSEIYKTLNETFYETLSNEIKTKIEEWNWWYGDIDFTYAINLTGEELYQIETGKEDSQYYGKIPSEKGKEIIIKKWEDKKKAKIGLMYLHDYYYQSKENECNVDKGKTLFQKCMNNGWMHMAHNGDTSHVEWFMTRIGRSYIKDSNDFGAWSLASDGAVMHDYLGRVAVVRPVFYLKNDINIAGSGTTQNPFYIAS